jgi:hypothetical protein
MSPVHLRRLPQLCGMPQKWDEMIPAPAEAGKNTRNAVAWELRLSFFFYQFVEGSLPPSLIHFSTDIFSGLVVEQILFSSSQEVIIC